jgi:hypothetical protein
VGLSRVELLTSRLSGVRSNQLSYRPRFLKPYNSRFASFIKNIINIIYSFKFFFKENQSNKKRMSECVSLKAL